MTYFDKYFILATCFIQTESLVNDRIRITTLFDQMDLIETSLITVTSGEILEINQLLSHFRELFSFYSSVCLNDFCSSFLFSSVFSPVPSGFA